MEHSETDMRANGRIKAILFDFGGTLDSDGLHWWQRLYEDVCNLDGSITQAEFFVFTDQAATQITALPDTKTLTMAATVERLCLHTHRAIIADRGRMRDTCSHTWEFSSLLRVHLFGQKNAQLPRSTNRSSLTSCLFSYSTAGERISSVALQRIESGAAQHPITPTRIGIETISLSGQT